MTATRLRRDSVFSWIRMARLGPFQGPGLWGSMAMIAAYLALSIAEYGDPYVIDEAVFPYVAEGILKNGAPYFYNGETRPHDLGLWHPPLYDYLLASQMLMFGTSPYSVRAFGAVCVIGSFFILCLALKRIAPGIGQSGFVALAALFLLNPLVVSNALVPDIDGSLGVVLVATALWASTVVAQAPMTPRMVVAITVFAFVAFSTKYTIAGIVAAMVGTAVLLSPAQRWRKLAFTIAAFVGGAALALGALFALGALLDFDARDPFDYLFGSLSDRTPGRSGLAGTLANLFGSPGGNITWIGPAIVLAAVISAVVTSAVRPPMVRPALVAFCAAWGVAIVVAYSYISGSPFGFPKYTSIAVAALSLAVVPALGLSRMASVRGGRSIGWHWIVWAVYVAVLLSGVGGIVALALRWHRVDLRSVTDLAAIAALTFLCVMVATMVLVLILRRSRDDMPSARWRRPLVISSLAALVITPAIVQGSSSVVNAVAQYSTRYYFGETGMSEFLESAEHMIPREEEIIAPKDIGLQIHRPFHEDALLLLQPPERFREELQDIKAPFFVTRSAHDYSESVFPLHFEIIRDFYMPVLSERGGSFTLWKWRSSVS